MATELNTTELKPTKKRKRKMCNFEGCEKIAQGKTDKCVRHGGGNKCDEPGCASKALSKNKCAKHGGRDICSEPGCEKGARSKNGKCKKHGGGLRCVEDGCNKSAVDAYDKCKLHGGGKRCMEPGCKKSALGTTNNCAKHGGGRRCVQEGCKSIAERATDKCVKHGGGKLCIVDDCKKKAQGSTDRCYSHGGGLRCPNCALWPDSRKGRKEFDGYCATCFKRVFPNDERSKIIYQHTKEIRVRNMINKYFNGFVHDSPLYTHNCDCTHRRRIDHRKLINETILAIETDEFAHRNYDEHDEEIRYDDLYMIHSGKWIFIRFNPDNNRDKTDFEDKLTELKETMEEQILRIENGENNELLEIIKLYY